MEQHFQSMEQDMLSQRYIGTSGNGLVTITLNGKLEIVLINIKPECIDPEDPECLQDLIISAHKNAVSLIEEEKKQNSRLLPFG